MSKYKVIYDAAFTNHEDIIEADSLEEAKEIAEAGSVYRYFTVEAIDETE